MVKPMKLKRVNTANKMRHASDVPAQQNGGETELNKTQKRKAYIEEMQQKIKDLSN